MRRPSPGGGTHRDPALIAVFDLRGAEVREGLAQVEVAPGGLLEERVEAIADGGELEPGEHGVKLGVFGDHSGPPATAS